LDAPLLLPIVPVDGWKLNQNEPVKFTCIQRDPDKFLTKSEYPYTEPSASLIVLYSTRCGALVALSTSVAAVTVPSGATLALSVTVIAFEDQPAPVSACELTTWFVLDISAR
jgi:hypothetical protein